ncbi:heat shock factor 2-binding protein-like isoform X2 [Anneissia japonica]|uniref:heat shock factor 2-binding protein-like isoform X2 n=1 Tax=Anneissia japonica TaxID=1529436 RepID=UPI00142580BF|nr:heat shock factor 2-binding protein-like isoform X2 [Anneissia japonica]
MFRKHQMDSSAEENSIALVADPSIMLIKQTDFEMLKQETTRLKQNISNVFTQDVIEKIAGLSNIEKELEQTQQKLKEKNLEVYHWKSRFEKTQMDCQKERKEKICLQRELQEISQQHNLQSDYFASMGSTYCTALWRVSQNEQAVPKVGDLFQFVSQTLKSYIETYHDDMPAEESTEAQFACSLCGIITNIAASSFGRDVLADNPEGMQVIDTMMSMLIDAPTKGASQMKNLILMSLYNLTINKKGFKYITTKTSILDPLATLLKEECGPELKLHSLLLIQSLITEHDNINFLQSARKLLSTVTLDKLCRSQCSDVRKVAMEIQQDLRLYNEQ